MAREEKTRGKSFFSVKEHKTGAHYVVVFALVSHFGSDSFIFTMNLAENSEISRYVTVLLCPVFTSLSL